MLFEYAVEPALVATWADRRTGRYFRDKFGIGSPRLISRFPKRWKKRALDAAWKASETEGGGEVARRRMEELIQQLSEVMVERRGAVWDAERSWTENAAGQEAPFHAILARRNPTGDPKVLVADELDESTPGWVAPYGRAVARKAETIADAVGGMLRIATDIIFVDPYFAPGRRDFVRVIASCVRAGCTGRAGRSARVRIFSSDREETNGTREHFRAGCRQRLPREFPAGQAVVIRRLGERTGGENLHNRYILTELGGVSLGAGLDESEAGATDDLNLLANHQYRVAGRNTPESRRNSTNSKIRSRSSAVVDEAVRGSGVLHGMNIDGCLVKNGR